MSDHRFWYIDDDHRDRWAVRVSSGHGGEPRIVFTTRDRQVSTAFDLDKEERLLTRYELLELLSEAKIEAVSAELRAMQVAA